MSAELNELARLAADVRAVLEDGRLRGVRGEPTDAPLPEAIAPPDGWLVQPDVEPAPVEAPSVLVDDWSQLARRAREERPASAVLLRRIRTDLGECRRCALCRDRRNIVFGAGDEGADLLIIGEAPDYHEDQKGEPFVGPAGEMLDKMLKHVLGLDRPQTYTLNTVKCRPPKNRQPLPAELDACRPFLEGQIDAIAPKVVLVLGSVALGVLFGADIGDITRNRGRWRMWRGVPVMPTFHPAYLLRQPQDKRRTFEDLKAVRTRYDELGGQR